MSMSTPKKIKTTPTKEINVISTKKKPVLYMSEVRKDSSNVTNRSGMQFITPQTFSCHYCPAHILNTFLTAHDFEGHWSENEACLAEPERPHDRCVAVFALE